MSMLQKVAIVGPESTGKTYLAAQLANYYNCYWVPEYAREYLENLNASYNQKDVEKIAKGQIDYEDVLTNESNKILICDTNLLTVKIWLEHKYNNCPDWINNEIQNRKYALHLITYPDIPYEHDPLRENPELGEYFFKKYKSLLTRYQFPFVIIEGDYETRMKKAVHAISDLLN
jgi:NadR type nicotinamide-nucleotide adenylyltransferase